VCLSLVCRVTWAPMAARVWCAGQVSCMEGLCQLCVCVCWCVFVCVCMSLCVRACAPARAFLSSLGLLPEEITTCLSLCSPGAGGQAHTRRWQATSRAPPAPATLLRPAGTPRASPAQSTLPRLLGAPRACVIR
jgi:hypothetical protein